MLQIYESQVSSPTVTDQTYLTNKAASTSFLLAIPFARYALLSYQYREIVRSKKPVRTCSPYFMDLFCGFPKSLFPISKLDSYCFRGKSNIFMPIPWVFYYLLLPETVFASSSMLNGAQCNLNINTMDREKIPFLCKNNRREEMIQFHTAPTVSPV